MKNSIINKECKLCNKVMKYQCSWNRHLKSKKHIQLLDSEQKVNTSEQKVNTKVYMKNFMCEYCNKKFTTATSRYRHIRNYCKQKNNNNIIEKTLF